MEQSPSSPLPRKSQRNSTLDGVNVQALAKSTRKTLERLAPFCLLRPTGPVQDAALMNKIAVKIKNLIDGIDSSMLATQSALTLANEALRLAEPTKSPTDQEWSIVPRRAVEGLGRLAGIATLGDKHAQKTGTVFRDVAQDLHKVAAMTKEKRDVMVIVLLDPEQADHTTKKSLRDVGLDLHANLNLLTDFAQQVSALANWWAFVRQEIEVASAAALLTSDPDAQPASPTSPGAMALPPVLNVDVWTRVQADYHSYFRTIRQVQSRYPNLVVASNEAWQLSAKSISLSPPVDESDSDRSASPSPLPVSTAAPLPPNPNQTPTTPTSPTTYYDARSRPLSTAFEDGELPNNRQKKKKGFNLRAATLSARSASTAGLSTDPKLSVKKMRAFLFTRTVPRPEVKGLFPSSINAVKMSLSRSKSSASGSSEQKGKGKEKEKSELAGPPTPRMQSFLNAQPSEKDLDFQAAASSSVVSKSEKNGDIPHPSLLRRPSSLLPIEPPRSPSPALSYPDGIIRPDKEAEEEEEQPQPHPHPQLAGASLSEPALGGAQHALIDEQTATKARGGLAIFRVAETIMRTGAKRLMCSSCFGYGDP